LKTILHDWDDESCIKILENCRQAMTRGGRIAVVEMIVGELSDPGPAALTDMNMLAAVPGQERSLTEYEALLCAAGLRRTSVRSNGSPLSVIEAIARPEPERQMLLSIPPMDVSTLLVSTAWVVLRRQAMTEESKRSTLVANHRDGDCLRRPRQDAARAEAGEPQLQDRQS
jgi:O-methyltransferase domain